MEFELLIDSLKLKTATGNDNISDKSLKVRKGSTKAALCRDKRNS